MIQDQEFRDRFLEALAADPEFEAEARWFDGSILLGERAEVAILPDIGHYPMFEDPEGLAELVDSFVRANAALARV